MASAQAHGGGGQISGVLSPRTGGPHSYAKISEFNPKSPPERYVHFEFLTRLRALRLDAVIYPSNRSEEETRENHASALVAASGFGKVNLGSNLSCQKQLCTGSKSFDMHLYLDYAHCVEGRAIPSWRSKDY
jgi:hypothetical protein